ncbi:TraR/DksA family transcriptional regulator [Streptomyces iconiensis]|uniref:TraR/DksA C4-type zinc finger protein n=1 Tax=Streptomyces iconiensis TaxID=1384038 RepID=A0ABT7A1Y9_9ACTN|nr:TraR/DksA C4-type zinc finger protein [Streptomyces iconiensis]MDJ1135321.1 TraR/DksA C4-type zinc finger protein [Streptomyces iconiensis]
MVAEESAAKKTAAKKTTHKAAAAKKTTSAAGTSAPGEAEAPAKKAAKKEPAKKAAAKKAPAKKAGAKKSAAKASAENAAPASEDAAKTTGANTVAAKKTPEATQAEAVPPARAADGQMPPGELAVRPGEDPWTPQEVEEAREGLRGEVVRLRQEITASEEALTGLMRDSGDGAGDDDADTGTKNVTREHEMSLAANAREMLYQTERALERLDAGTYGLCENCGKPIGKARMQAFPRATLCVECKQKQERR